VHGTYLELSIANIAFFPVVGHHVVEVSTHIGSSHLALLEARQCSWLPWLLPPASLAHFAASSFSLLLSASSSSNDRRKDDDIFGIFVVVGLFEQLSRTGTGTGTPMYSKFLGRQRVY
jgi:hypothetical protein